jgi:TetR/AcrR family transcriptional repressor of bet genes
MAGSYRYLPDGDRRGELVDATLECIAELGLHSTTVRAVAAKAGVSIGLIRHHFENKANLIFEAYSKTMQLITASAHEVLISKEGTPRQRLRQFVKVALGGQAADPRMFALWATFISQVRINPSIAAFRKELYIDLRRATEDLLDEIYAAEGAVKSREELERLACTINAVLDGLWIEACLDESGKSVDHMIDIAVETIDVLLSVQTHSKAGDRKTSQNT